MQLVFFKPYRGRGTNVVNHVKIRGVWMQAVRVADGNIAVSRLGWGETFAGCFEDFSEEEQALLRTTLID